MIFPKLSSLIAVLRGDMPNIKNGSPEVSEKPLSGQNKFVADQDLIRSKLVATAENALLKSYFQKHEAAYGHEITDEMRGNALILCNRVANLLIDIGARYVSLSSGWRPASVNKTIPNAAKKSLHMSGMAIDLVDTREQELCKKIESKPELLERYGLWMEDKSSSPSWCHLDIGTRKPRKVRIFKP